MNQQLNEKASLCAAAVNVSTGIASFDNVLPVQYGPSRACAEVLAHVRTLPYGEIAVEVTIRPNGDRWHHLYVSLGGGEFTSESIGKALPEEGILRSKATGMAAAAVEKKQTLAQQHATALSERQRLNEEKGLRIGRQWSGAQAYVQGRKGLTTYDKATIVAIDDSGFVTVECYKRGMRAPERITADANSRLFESLPAKREVSQPTKDKLDALAPAVYRSTSDEAGISYEKLTNGSWWQRNASGELIATGPSAAPAPEFLDDLVVVPAKDQGARARAASGARQRDVAQAVFEEYDFGNGFVVHGDDLWEIGDQCVCTKIAYVEYPDDGPDCESHKVQFHVRFNHDGTFAEALARDMVTGSLIGERVVSQAARQLDLLAL
ncbi:hypothetical protein [Paraburkholderia sp. SIMBA_054]|uniref:hypothetical protein n=1 Tax=Paraburkholderia sp. SIMBA_054 TaxID=3085795 RepID=UPI00397B8593